MNLFILSWDFKECAEFMFDKHVSKILLEAVQMLCTTIQIVDPENEITKKIQIYKIAHKNHPVTIWMRQSLENYIWTLNLVDAMHDEWKFRYDHPEEKMHKSYVVAKYLREYAPSADKFPSVGLTTFALAMPPECKREDPIESYRTYYQSAEKQKIASWKKRDKPTWYKLAFDSFAKPSASLILASNLGNTQLHGSVFPSQALLAAENTPKPSASFKIKIKILKNGPVI
jgi:hypothetical protein